MFRPNVISGFLDETRPRLRESLAGGLGALAARFGGSPGRGPLLAAALVAGLIGGTVPAALSAHRHDAAETASLSRAVDELQKLETQQTADAEAVGAAAQANAALQARLDTLEKRLAKVERANLDSSPTSAIAAPDHPLPPPRPDGRRKPPKG
jgi:hypothetical protein